MEYLQSLTAYHRPAPLLQKQLQQKVWHEIVTALSKDVPEVIDLVRKS